MSKSGCNIGRNSEKPASVRSQAKSNKDLHPLLAKDEKAESANILLIEKSKSSLDCHRYGSFDQRIFPGKSSNNETSNIDPRGSQYIEGDQIRNLNTRPQFSRLAEIEDVKIENKPF